MAKTNNRRFDLVGQTFGSLTVLQQGAGRSGKYYKSRTWICACECGNSVEVTSDSLRTGNTRSCGCRKLAAGRTNRISHGLSHTTTYNSWMNMKARCLNPDHPRYADYGERGVTVCDRWLHSFENFFADMGERPKGTSLERLQNHLGYSPENCSWESSEIQNNNKRSNHTLTLNGITKTMAEWAKESPLSYTTIRSRVNRFGWSDKDALTIPVGSKRVR